MGNVYSVWVSFRLLFYVIGEYTYLSDESDAAPVVKCVGKEFLDGGSWIEFLSVFGSCVWFELDWKVAVASVIVILIMYDVFSHIQFYCEKLTGKKKFPRDRFK